MNERPTPETDAARHDLSDYGSPVPCSYGDWVPFEVAGKLERERDEAREQLAAAKHFLEKYIAERDEARAERDENRFLLKTALCALDEIDLAAGKFVNSKWKFH